MAWPTDTIVTANLDAGTNDPSQARSDLLNALNVIKAILAQRGAENGVAPPDGLS